MNKTIVDKYNLSQWTAVLELQKATQTIKALSNAKIYILELPPQQKTLHTVSQSLLLIQV